MNTWQIDPAHSSAHFTVKHMMIAKVRGGFEKLQGTMSFDPKEPASLQVKAEIDAASINTQEEKRDAHLRSADFFDVERYPTLSFHSTEVQEQNGKLSRVIGELTIHGVTRSVAFEVEEIADEIKDPWGNRRIGISAQTKIKRKDFGLSWNAALETGGVLVGDEVSIGLDVQFVRQA